MTVKKFCKYAECGSFEHLLFLFRWLIIRTELFPGLFYYFKECFFLMSETTWSWEIWHFLVIVTMRKILKYMFSIVLWSPLCTSNCLKHANSNGSGAVQQLSIILFTYLVWRDSSGINFDWFEIYFIYYHIIIIIKDGRKLEYFAKAPSELKKIRSTRYELKKIASTKAWKFKSLFDSSICDRAL